jgi:hypothetical protein
MTREIKISKAITIIIFIALIRTISEIFRLQYYSSVSVTFEQIMPFLLAGLIISLSLFAMTILHYYGKYRIIISLGVLTIIAMLVIKYFYLE